MNIVFYNITSLLFPYPCIGCGAIDTLYYGICKKCYNSFQSARSCIYCGERDCIGDCINIHPYKYIFSLYEYSPLAHRLLVEMKFKRHIGIVKVIYKLLEDYFFLYDNVYEVLNKVEAITFVPISKKRMQVRGFNQAEIFAKVVGEMLNKNVVNIFEKVKETDHQSHLSRKERLLNLQSSIITKKSYKNAYMSSIIVVDDVFTTGATLSTVAEVSKNDNVANSFIGVTVFRA